MKKSISFLLGVYLLSFIFVLGLSFLNDRFENIYLFSGLVALGVLLIVLVLFSHEEVGFLEEGSLRYSMLCNKCHWEWMSNTGEKRPSRCPSCKGDRLEVLGWRKVVNKKRGDKDLTSYFR
tara:strand:+ start:4041 stop:4403 length:363 start_codon:yes stop_codon:yes gene_type:complete